MIGPSGAPHEDPCPLLSVPHSGNICGATEMPYCEIVNAFT